jgi:hypothetical protein
MPRSSRKQKVKERKGCRNNVGDEKVEAEGSVVHGNGIIRILRCPSDLSPANLLCAKSRESKLPNGMAINQSEDGRPEKRRHETKTPFQTRAQRS